jgi:hypothetical protein
VGFAGLAAAQLSGFGVYMAGSTLLGTLNSALGLGLGFGAFTGLSQVIAVVIGPIGWVALGLYTIKKLGGPNYKKLLPIVLLIASERARGMHQVPPALLLPPAQTSTATKQTLPIPERQDHGRLPPTALPSEPMAAAARGAQPVPSIRRYSKAEKTNFELRPENRELCKLMEELWAGTHFLELSLEQQQTIREWRQEQIESEIESKRAAEEPKRVQANDARKQRKQREAIEHSDKKQRRKHELAVQKLGNNYGKLLRNLEFDFEVLERLETLAVQGGASQIDDKLGLMNVGSVIYRDSISGTKPKLYEERAGYDYRVYFYPNGPKIRIRLVGDKGTQPADIEQLRRRAAGHATGS